MTEFVCVLDPGPSLPKGTGSGSDSNSDDTTLQKNADPTKITGERFHKSGLTLKLTGDIGSDLLKEEI